MLTTAAIGTSSATAMTICMGTPSAPPAPQPLVRQQLRPVEGDNERRDDEAKTQRGNAKLHRHHLCAGGK